MLIEVKAKVARVIDSKTVRKNETFIVSAGIFAQAEYKVTELLTQQQQQGIVEDFEILSLKISVVREVDEQTLSESLPSFVITLVDLFHDDEGNETQLKYRVLLWADSLLQANRRALELSHQGYDMIIEGIKQVDYTFINNNEQ